MLYNMIYTHQLKRNIYNLSKTVFIILPYKIKKTTTQTYLNQHLIKPAFKPVSKWLMYLTVDRSGRVREVAWANKCMHQSSLMKKIVCIENYVSHYLGYRSWLFCRLRPGVPNLFFTRGPLNLNFNIRGPHVHLQFR